MPAVFTTIFICVLCLSYGLRYWLSWRNLRHIQRHRDQVPATFSADISLAEHQHAADYNCARIRISAISSLVDLVLLLALTFGQGLNLFWQLVGHWLHPPLLQGTAFIAITLVVSNICSLPAEIYSTFVIEQRFGFNKMSWRLWLGDGIKNLLLSVIIGLPLLLLVLWLMQQAGTQWWLWVWLILVVVTLLMQIIYPVWIAPLFNRFTPLADATLKARIEALLTRCGFKSQGIYVMDGSARSSHGNAYFTGFGKSKRIVFFDTLIEKLQPAETEAVLAHELGHFKHRHVLRRMILTFLLSLLGLVMLGWLIQAPWFYLGMGLNSMGAAQGLLLFVLLAPIFTFPLTPLFSRLSRRQEFQADAFAVAETGGQPLTTALIKLYRDNASTLTPDPVYSAFYHSHPPAAIRIAQIQQGASR